MRPSSFKLAVTLRGTIRIARVVLTVLLVAAFLSSIAPIASVSAGNLCTLACCAGRAPHAAGSCMEGTCEIAIHRKQTVHRHVSQRSEELCGAKSIAKTRTTKPRSASKDSAQSAKAEAATLNRPCLPDCASCSGFTSSNSWNRLAALTRVERTTAPAVLSYAPANVAVALSDSFGYSHAPRGPPVYDSV